MFSKASITVFQYIIIVLCFRSGTIRKSVWAVDEKQDISLLWADMGIRIKDGWEVSHHANHCSSRG